MNRGPKPFGSGFGSSDKSHRCVGKCSFCDKTERTAWSMRQAHICPDSCACQLPVQLGSSPKNGNLLAEMLIIY